MKLTELEKIVMSGIPEDNFYEDGFESALWADIFIENMEEDPKKVRGALSSLIKKEFINMVDDERSKIITLQDNGVQWLKDHLVMDEYGDPIRPKQVEFVALQESDQLKMSKLERDHTERRVLHHIEMLTKKLNELKDKVETGRATPDYGLKGNEWQLESDLAKLEQLNKQVKMLEEMES